MRNESSGDYHARRAREEAEQAERCRNIQARALHKTLRALHAERAAAGPTMAPEPRPGLKVVASA